MQTHVEVGQALDKTLHEALGSVTCTTKTKKTEKLWIMMFLISLFKPDILNFPEEKGYKVTV